MIIVSFHVLTMEDALLKVQEVYEDPWQAFQMGATGILFIFIGLLFTQTLIKRSRRDDELVLYGKWGYMSVSVRTIDDLVRRVLRRFDVVREVQIETNVDGSQLKIVANLSVLAGWSLPELINTIQTDLSDRLNKMLGGGVELELIVNVIKIIEDPMIRHQV